VLLTHSGPSQISEENVQRFNRLTTYACFFLKYTVARLLLRLSEKLVSMGGDMDVGATVNQILGYPLLSRTSRASGTEGTSIK
jgi:hypothetical protein